MLKLTTMAVLISVATSGASAAMIDLRGGGDATLPTTAGTGAGFYDPQNLTGNPDPWGAETTVRTGVESLLGDHATHVELTYRGNESGFDNELRLGDTTLFTSNHTAAGSVVSLTADEFGRLTFFSNGGGAGRSLTDDGVAVTAMANVMQVGFNDGSPVDADFDDLRFEAVVTPVPAALPLMATGLAGMAWWRRRQRHAA
jgi:hypothetical protein